MNMNPTTSETNEPINITPMTWDEARSCVAAIRSNLESLGAMLLDLERRRGWEALGYSSFRECAIAEFGKSQGYVYKLLHAASVDENLAASEIYPLDKSEIALIPTSHKEELHKLPFDQQAEALKKADALALAEGKYRQVKHVKQVVKEYKSIAAETAALGKSLGLPTQGDSVLPQSDRIDDLTHISPADVDDRPGHPLTQLQPVSHNYNTGFSMTTENMFAPTPAQWQAAQAKHAELLQALRDAQIEIEQLSAENLKLHEANSDLHQEIALLLTELAALKAQLQP